MRHSPHHPPCQSPGFPSTDLRRRSRAWENGSEGSGNLSPLSPPPPGQLRGWQSAAALASVRGALTCSACHGPDASLPCAGKCGAGTQTGVTTASKAASRCSSRSREGPASPPSSLSDPPSQGLVGSSTGPSPPPPHAPSPPPPSCARGPVTQLVSLQSESPQVASSPCGWSLPFSCCQGGSASPLPPSGLGSGLFCSFSEDCL